MFVLQFNEAEKLMQDLKPILKKFRPGQFLYHEKDLCDSENENVLCFEYSRC